MDGPTQRGDDVDVLGFVGGRGVGLCVALSVGVGSLCGCGEDTVNAGPIEVCDNAVDDDGDGLVDCADPDCRVRLMACRRDARVLDSAGADRGASGDAVVSGDAGTSLPIGLQALVTKLLLPSASKPYGVDMTGDGKVDNRLGTLLSGLSGIHPSMDLQADLDSQIQKGNLLLLQEVRSSSLTSSASATVRVGFGKDLDGKPGDNFSGKEPFVFDPKVPTSDTINGAIKAGAASFGPGELVGPVALGKVFVAMQLRRAQIRAKVSASGMTDGVLAGAIRIEDVKNTLLPGLATEMTRQYHDPSLTANGKILVEFFDTNKDKTVTVQELLNNNLVKTLVLNQPDVDTNKDGKPDAISMGVGFTAVSCTINPPK